jgi:hypothetical protein
MIRIEGGRKDLAAHGNEKQGAGEDEAEGQGRVQDEEVEGRGARMRRQQTSNPVRSGALMRNWSSFLCSITKRPAKKKGVERCAIQTMI